MSEFDPASLGTVLGVWAHPDDEAYLSAGIMAMARRCGSRVVCATATKGEAGSPDETRWPIDAIGAIRAAELEASLALLGVDEHLWLGYQDGQCSLEPQEAPVRRLVELLQTVRPDTVLTFGPDGFTNHPDHRAVSAWITEACEQWDRSFAGLHYAVQTTEWTDRYAAEFAAHGVFDPGTPPAVAPDDLSIDLSLPVPVSELKWKALCLQSSQTEGLIELVGEQLYREALIQTERFRVARSW